MRMNNRDKVVKGLEIHADRSDKMDCNDCPYIKDGFSKGRCISQLCSDALSLLKEQEARELTMDEWREWKANKKRDPICELWEYETTPMWILNPNNVHEPAFLMGKLKLFTGKPTFEQCKAVKWDKTTG